MHTKTKVYSYILKRVNYHLNSLKREIENEYNET